MFNLLVTIISIISLSNICCKRTLVNVEVDRHNGETIDSIYDTGYFFATSPIDGQAMNYDSYIK